jgi:MFS-type transporter involved in bile tolerance (Atg22 family)
MITLVALLLVSNIAFKLSDLQYDALVAQIPSQQSSQRANFFSRRIVGTNIA